MTGSMDLATTRVLLVEDNLGDARLIRELVADSPSAADFAVDHVDTVAGALQRLARRDVDVVLLDLTLPDGVGIDTVKRVTAAARDVPIVVLTGLTDDELALAAMKEGAQDYLSKASLDTHLLVRAIRYAVERKHAEESVLDLLAEQRLRVQADRAAQRARFLADTGAALSVSLDLDDTVRRLARAVMPTLADDCLVDVVERDGSLRRMLADSADPARRALVARTLEFPPDQPQNRTPSFQAIQTRRPVVVREFSDEVMRSISDDEERVKVARAIAPRALIAVPLVARDRVIGAITLIASQHRRPYGDDDVALAEEVAHHAAIAVDNALLYRDAQLAIAESQRARAEAEHAYAEAKQAVRAREEILAVVSHDLRNPLSVIGLALKHLHAEVQPGSPRGKQLLERAERGFSRMNRMINDLLDLSRIDSGGLTVDPSPQDLTTTVADAVELMRSLAMQKSLTLELEAPADRVTVSVDRDRIAQVLSNLIGNALKFTPAGGHVRVRLEPLPNEARVAVSDTGPGIAAADLPKIFERFWQGRRSAQGAGLGLAIAQGIVEAHGGKLWAESEVGHGSTFSFTVKRCEPELRQALAV